MIPGLIELQRQFGAKGLHIFFIETQETSAEDIRKLLEPKGVNFPVGLNSMRENYESGPRIPTAWIIGVDGKVIWQGNPARQNYKAVLIEELAKVKYPGLGKGSVDPLVEPAAKLWNTGQFGQARSIAARVKEDPAATDAARADADHLIKRVNKKLLRMREKADQAREDRRYPEAIAAYEEISKAFKDSPDGVEIDSLLKEMKADKKVKAEIKAWEDFASLQKQIAKQNPAQKKASLENFAKARKDTRAAEEATKEADAIVVKK